MKITPTMVLFWGGPFSQWFMHDMTIGGTHYNCAEQYMMAMKAREFGDDETYDAIMASSDPRAQKALGRMVKEFEPKQWNAISRDVVFVGNLVKFRDSPDLRKILMGTGDRLIVEASPYDTVWGIGLGEKDPAALNKAMWRGTNWLGEALMKVRDELIGFGY